MMLAIVGLLVLAIGMYTSYNLSRAVYEKIQLQNAADATAYSLATLEARTFNFIAFANRAQVANYVQIMEAQSLLSNVSHFAGMTGYMADFLLSLGRFLDTVGLGELGAALEAVGQAFFYLHQVADVSRDVMETSVPLYVKLKTTENYFYFWDATMMAAATSMQLFSGGGGIVEANDPDARLTPVSYALNVLNVASYVTAFDWASTNLIGSTDDKEAADRVMTEVTAASRYSAVIGSENFVVSRTFAESFTGLMADAEAILTQDWDHDSRREKYWKKKALRKMRKLFDKFGVHIGTTKMLTSGRSSQLPDFDETAEHAPEHSDLALGDAIVAKDLPGLMPLVEDMGFASVRSTLEKSEHCFYEKPPGFGTPNFFRILGLLANPENYGFECKDQSDPEHQHQWRSLLPGLLKGGVAPYFKFAPKLSGWQAEKTSFNQPDVWVFLNKSPEHMAMGGTGDLEFEIQQGHMRGELDARIGEDGVMGLGIGKGINVLARAQVYYHRPGAWHEPPNFFNPYWGARLGPKNVAIKRLTSELGLSGAASQLIADNIWMH
ncbi:Tad domain-containing protein [Myxococcota bacterium]